MEDRKILALLWERAEQALTALADKFGSRLYRLSMNILGHPADAEESVNDTYLALWDAIPPARPDPLAGYVYRVGRNTALKHLRENTALSRDSRYDLCLDELAGCIGTCSLDEAMDARLLGLAIDRFLDTLSKDNRVLFLRRYWFGDCVQQLAKSNHMTQNAVSVRLHRIRTQLHTYLIKEGYLYEK